MREQQGPQAVLGDPAMDGPTLSEASLLGEPFSARDTAKLERACQARAAEAAKELARQMRAALRTPEGERSAAAVSLLITHAVEASRLQVTMAKHAARKAADAANMAEVEDDAEVLRAKLATLADAVRAAKHVVVYTGAGISTAANIPDYRGPQGIWTQMKAKAPKGPLGSVSSGSRAGSVDKLSVEPTRAHMALATLVRAGRVQTVISQNVDGLHLRSGVPSSKLCELHGNVFRERCRECGREYLRGFDVTDGSAYHRHATERRCDKPGCRAALHDTIVYFGEKIHERDLSTAQEASRCADLALFVGSSLKVLQHYRYMWEQGAGSSPPRKFFAIVNLQPTPKDKVADVVLRARCDDVLVHLVAALGLEVEAYDPMRDAVLRLCHAKRPAGGSVGGKPVAPVQAPLEQPAPTRQGSKQAKSEEAKPASGKPQSGGRGANGAPSGRQASNLGSGAEEAEESFGGRGKPPGKPSKVVLCCHCGVMLDNEKGKTIRDGCGTCDGKGCDHWACMPCSGVEPGYDGEWFCGCDACGGGAGGKASGAKGRGSAGSAAREVTSEAPAAAVVPPSAVAPPAVPTPTAPVEAEAGASGKKPKPSKLVLCCHCGVMLDNEKGKTVRDGFGTCDADGCENWACMRCCGVDPDHEGEWFCGCESCPGEPCAVSPTKQAAPGKGVEVPPIPTRGAPAAAEGKAAPQREKAAPQAKEAAVRGEDEEGARQSSAIERPVAKTGVSAEPPAAAEVKPPAQAHANGAGPSRPPSKVILCCHCGVMLDNEKGKTIRDGFGACDADGCEHWACMPCSGVDSGYDGEWFCGCDSCPRAAAPAVAQPADAGRRSARAADPPERRSKVAEEARAEAAPAAAPAAADAPDKAVRKQESPAASIARKDKAPADIKAWKEEPAAAQQERRDVPPAKTASKVEPLAAQKAPEVPAPKKARSADSSAGTARSEEPAAKRLRSDEARGAGMRDKTVSCCKCGLMLDNAKGTNLRDGCGPCDCKRCDHWACIPCANVEPGYDGEWFCPCDGCVPVPDASAGAAGQSATSCHKRVGEAEKVRVPHRKKVKSADSAAGGDSAPPVSLRRGRSADPESSAPEVKPPLAASSSPAAASKQQAGKLPARASRQPKAVPEARPPPAATTAPVAASKPAGKLSARALKQPEPKQPEHKQPEPKQPEPKQQAPKQVAPKQSEPKQPEPTQPEGEPVSRAHALKPAASERKAAARAPTAPSHDPVPAVPSETEAALAMPPPPPLPIATETVPTPNAPAAAPTPKAPAPVPIPKGPRALPTPKGTALPIPKAPAAAPTPRAPRAVPISKAPAAAPTPKAPKPAPTSKALAALPKQMQHPAPSPPPPVAAPTWDAFPVMESFLPPKKRLDGRLTPPMEPVVGSSAADVFMCAPSEQLQATVPSPLLRSADLLLSLQHSVPIRPAHPALPASAASDASSTSTAFLPQPKMEIPWPGR